MNHRQVWELTRYQSGMVVRGDMTIRNAAAQFIVSECDIMVVTDDHGLLLGVITESCIVRALLSGPPEDAAIAGWTHRNVDSVRENSDIQSVLPLFRLSSHSAVPVVNQDQKVCGLLRRQDVLAEMLKASPSRRTSAARSDLPMSSGCADNPASDLPVRTNHREE
ncbi:MAG: HPP family protein, partial [Phycisphaerae bacterium]